MKFRNIISGIQFNHKKQSKKHENCWYMSKKYIWNSACVFIQNRYFALQFPETIFKNL